MVLMVILFCGGCGGRGSQEVFQPPANGSPSAPGTSPAVLQSVQINPPRVSTVPGAAQQFDAVGLFSDGTTRVLTASATWTSSSQAVTVSSAPPTHGLALANAPAPSVTITASVGGTSASAVVSVAPHTLISIGVTPSATRAAVGTSVPFVATGVFSDGSTSTLTNDVTWTCSAPNVATLSQSGVATGVSAGTATVTASRGGIAGTAQLTVSNATLTSIQVTPALPSIAVGTTQQFEATGIFSDNTTESLTNQVTWTSSSASAPVSSSGVVTGEAVAANVAITATLGAVSGAAKLNVTSATLVSIEISPNAPSIALGMTVQLHAFGLFSDQSVQELTDRVVWTTADGSVALIRPGGLASSVGVGRTSVRATLGDTVGSTVLEVDNATLVSVSITPANQSIAKGTYLQFEAVATFTDGSTQDVTSQAVWSTSSPSVVISNASGTPGLAYAAAVSNGVSIVATVDGVSGGTTVNVTAATLQSLAVTVSPSSIALGTSSQATAIGTFSDGSTQDLTASASWSSSSTAVATIDGRGRIVSVGVGQAAITATVLGVSNSARVAVTPATLVSIAVAPAGRTLRLGSPFRFTATGSYSDGSTQSITELVTWQTRPASAMFISNASGTRGLARGLQAVENIAVTASLGGQTGSARVSVIPALRAVHFLCNEFASKTNGIYAFLNSATGGLLQLVEGSPFQPPPSLQLGNVGAVITASAESSRIYTTYGDAFEGRIGALSVDLRSGGLTPLPGAPFSVSEQAEGPIAVSPDGRFLYTTTQTANSHLDVITTYSIDPGTGALSKSDIAPVIGERPTALAISHDGHFLYVACEGTNNIFAFSRNSTSGQLNAVAGSPFLFTQPGGPGPETMVLHPSGRYLYAGYPGAFLTFVIDTNGALLPPGQSTTEINLSRLVMHPSGRFLYATTYDRFPGGPVIGYYRILANGSPSFVNFRFGNSRGMTADPRGDFVYTSDGVFPRQFRVDPDSGELSEVEGSPIEVEGKSVWAYATVVLPPP